MPGCQVRYDEMCDKHGVAFYAVTSRGPCCHFFANLHLHAYTPAVRAAAGLIDLAARFLLLPLDARIAASVCRLAWQESPVLGNLLLVVLLDSMGTA